MRRYDLMALLLAVVSLAGCAHYPVNPKLDTCNRDAGYRFKNLAATDNSDSLFVILAFSGGGTRAAALSYGVLEKLGKTEIAWEGKKRRLLDEVDVISSISGGSFTAAYFGLFGDRIFTDFETKFLKTDIQGTLFMQLLSPLNWFRLASPYFDRIDMAAEYYDEQVFDRRTFKDLTKGGKRPYIIINATDMTSGARFEFTQDQFDFLCSDLDGFSVSRAVAASSAFPVLLSPVTLRNYAGGCGFKEPLWVSNGLKDRDISARRYVKASQARSYQDAADRPFIHLLDGGIADNIGLRGPYSSIVSTDGGWSLLRMINQGKIRKVVVIVVNAATDPDKTYDRKESAPGVTSVLSSVVGVPMDGYSFETIELLRESLVQWNKDALLNRQRDEDTRPKNGEAKTAGGELAEVAFYPIVIAFDSIQDPGEKAFFKNLPTTFSLPADTVDRLRSAGAQLLDESEEFKRLLKELK